MLWYANSGVYNTDSEFEVPFLPILENLSCLNSIFDINMFPDVIINIFVAFVLKPLVILEYKILNLISIFYFMLGN